MARTYLSVERKKELLQWFYQQWADNLDTGEVSIKVTCSGNTYDIEIEGSEDVQWLRDTVTENRDGYVFKYPNFCMEDTYRSWLFHANTTDMGELMNYVHIDPWEYYSDEVSQFQALGHHITEVRPLPWDLVFCTLVCKDEVMGQYYIHCDDGDARISFSDKWHGSCEHESTVGDYSYGHIEDLRGVWQYDS